MFTRCPQQARPAFLRQPRSQCLIKSRPHRSPLAVVDTFLSANSPCPRFATANPRPSQGTFCSVRSPARHSPPVRPGSRPATIPHFRLTPLESVLTANPPASPVDSALTKNTPAWRTHGESLNAINDLQPLFYRTLRLVQFSLPVCEQPPSTSVPHCLEPILYPRFYCSWSPRQITLAFH